LHLFIIPGNPPALYFYKLWAEEIQREYAGCSVCISPYQHTPVGVDSFTYLDNAVQIHGQELAAFHKAQRKKIVIVGHSLGAWMALRLLERHSSIIESCILLYPFLRRPSIKGRAILKSIRHLYRIPLIEDLLLRCRGILERLFEDLKYVTDEELRTSLALAYHEYEVIGRYKKTLQIPEQLREKLYMIYCDQDTWCSSRTINEMKKWISSEKTKATHGFIVSAQERATVLDALLHRISPQNQLLDANTVP
jgi:surfactin synthase thioesterase subunit